MEYLIILFIGLFFLYWWNKPSKSELSERQANKEKRIKQNYKKSVSKKVNLNDLDLVNLACTLCGTTNCKNKNSCIVTSD